MKLAMRLPERVRQGAADTDPRESADVVVRVDRPGHPAWTGLPG